MRYNTQCIIIQKILVQDSSKHYFIQLNDLLIINRWQKLKFKQRNQNYKFSNKIFHNSLESIQKQTNRISQIFKQIQIKGQKLNTETDSFLQTNHSNLRFPLYITILIYIQIRINFQRNNDLMSIFDLDTMTNLFVRPTRQVYKKSDLGRNELKISNMKFQRIDFRLPTSKGGFLECSIFSPYENSNLNLIDKCIVYLHCNTGCRIEGLPYIKYLLPQGYAVLLFDFCGSGISSGDYVSLGFNETFDIKIVINYLRKINRFMKIGLWGRSMGAVAAIRYCSNHSDITIAILDSPFSSLLELALDLGNKKTYLPNFILEFLFKFLDPRIRQKAGIGLYEIDNKQIINRIKVPVIFMASKKDSVVNFQQVQSLFETFTGEKQLIFIEKDHNELRDPDTIRNIIKYMKNAFQPPLTTQVQSRQNSIGSITLNSPYRISISQIKNEDKSSIRTMQSNITLHSHMNTISHQHPHQKIKLSQHKQNLARKQISLNMRNRK